jgi:hypothetical protein
VSSSLPPRHHGEQLLRLRDCLTRSATDWSCKNSLGLQITQSICHAGDEPRHGLLNRLLRQNVTALAARFARKRSLARSLALASLVQ